MKYLSTLLILFGGFSLFAQQNIIDVRKLNTGDKATITGIVTNGDELGSIRYIQDATGGLAVYDSKLSAVKRGDSITVSGEINPYRNLFEITKVSDFTVHTSGNPLPAPKIISIADLGENYEGQLVQINNVEFTDASGVFAGNKNYTITDGANNSDVRISTSSPIVGQGIIHGKINLVAICGQYSYNQDDTQTGYQLIPRDMDDFISGKSVKFTSPVMQVDANKHSIRLGWSTDTGATPFVRYGNANQTDSLIHIVQGNSTTGDQNWNEAAIEGLSAAQIIYAQAFSVNESDTAFSNIGAYVTESNSSGKIDVYFNTEVNTQYKTISEAKNIGNALEDTLIAYINRAAESIDFCIYNINNSGLSSVSEALNNAYNRGIEVRFITCGTTAHSGADDLVAGIPQLVGPDEFHRDGIMHNKFAVIDANSANPDKPVVWSGSTNITYDQIQTDANNMIFIQDQSLAKSYRLEFDEMWGSNTNTPNFGNAKFGADKSNNTPHEFLIGGNRVQSYFSPSDGTNQKIIDAINTADNDLEIETMLITRSDIGYAISDAKQRGVNVQVLTNASGGNSSTVNNTLTGILLPGNFVQDENGKGTLHHKLAIIDANMAASDPQVITGSHNWSNSANDKNDENTLVIHNADVANQYFQQFAFRFVQNGGQLLVSANHIEVNNVKVYPNPTNSVINIQSAATIKRVSIYSVSGILVDEIASNNWLQTQVNFSNKKTGVYVMKVEFESGSRNMYKIIKQ